MKPAVRCAILVAVASLGPVLPSMRASGQELSADAKSKEAAEARAKRNAQQFENNATTIVFYDRAGQKAGTLGPRALYDETVISPDRRSIAVVTEDLANESADLYVVDIASGSRKRLTTSVRTEFVMAPVWSPDGRRIAYVTIRKGQEGIYVRDADGQGTERMVFRNPGAFLNLSDWSSDGKYLTFAKSDLGGGTLYVLPVDGDTGAAREATEIFHTDLRVFGPRFSPDGRYVSYIMLDKANKGDVFVRSVDPKSGSEAQQISDGSFSQGFWRRDGKEFYYVARDRSVMVSDVSTSPTFSFSKPKVLFRPASAVPDRVADISADGERFLALPPPRGPQLQQLTVFNRKGEVLQKIGEPGRYSAPSFSPDGTRLLVTKNDLKTGQSDLWTIDVASGKGTQLTNDTYPRALPIWSPDGRYIYYPSFRNGDIPIYRLPSDGSGKEELVFRYTAGAGITVSDISPDGRFLICDSGGVVLVVPLTGDPSARKEIEFLREEFTDGVARLSPDGKFIAYRSDEAKPERGEVYVRPFDASTQLPGDG